MVELQAKIWRSDVRILLSKSKIVISEGPNCKYVSIVEGHKSYNERHFLLLVSAYPTQLALTSAPPLREKMYIHILEAASAKLKNAFSVPWYGVVRETVTGDQSLSSR